MLSARLPTRAIASATATVLFALLLSACSTLPAIIRPPASLSLTAPGRGIVYLFRGGFNIFSTGMDDLESQLHAVNVDALSLGHNQWREVAAVARANYQANKTPIVLIGHSWGALAAVLVAMELNKTNTPVPLMILYDPTDSVRIPPNVKHVINFVSNWYYAEGYRATPLPGTTGTIENIPELAYTHINIDNAEPLQTAAIAAILPIVNRKPPARKRP
jgi:pimeloyl-ACP methyl ester carboxylesterase